MASVSLKALAVELRADELRDVFRKVKK